MTHFLNELAEWIVAAVLLYLIVTAEPQSTQGYFVIAVFIMAGLYTLVNIFRG